MIIKKNLSTILFSLCAFFSIANFHVEALANQLNSEKESRNRIALIIGNSDYTYGPLKNPVNDALDFAATLKKLDFEVILVTNSSLEEMDNAVNQFGRRLEQTKGVGLFFYAGHGVQLNGSNYLIPISSKISRETELKYQALNAQRIIDEMEYAKNGLNIVILDACRNNPLTRSFRSNKKGLAKFDNTPSGLLLAYSTAPGKQAADGDGRNSPYTKQLIQSIQKENVPLELVFKDVIKNVKKSTKGKQVPWVSSSVDGDFYFSRSVSTVQTVDTNNGTVEQTTNNLGNDSKYELLFWQTVMNNPSKSQYEAYLEKYPNGHFSSIARNELRQNQKVAYSEQSKKNGQYVKSEILSEIDICHEHLAKKRLTSGKSGNAFSCYKKILSKEPENSEALSGLEKIEKTYSLWASSSFRQGKYEQTRNYLNKLLLVNPANEEIQIIEDKLSRIGLNAQSNRSFSNGRAQSTKNSSLIAMGLRKQFEMAIKERDLALSEILLEKIRVKYPNSRVYEDMDFKYKKLVLEMESEKLYEQLFYEALEENDMAKAKSYLLKIQTVSADSPVYFELKEKLDTRVEENKKITLVLTANIDDNMVLINGVEKGSTPLTLSLPKGDYLVELLKRGYPKQRLKLGLYANATQHLELTGGFANGIALENPPMDIEMMAIEPGCFTMGSPSNEVSRSSHETPHKVCVKKGFWMGKYEITQHQWQAVMGKNPSYFDDCGPNCPVENIELPEVKSFLAKLSSLTRQTYRLPTEAEWEFSARAGTNTPFNTGACLAANQANFNPKRKYKGCESSSEVKQINSTLPVGSYPANAWGLHDMHGNVAEWTCTQYNGFYDGTEQLCFKAVSEMPGYSEESPQYAVRGGHWGNKAADVRSAYRDKEFHTANNKRMGFRVVREK